MRFAVLLTIVFISIIAINMKFPPIPLLSLYGFLIITPLILIILKKNLLNGLLLWFFFVLFKEFGRMDLPLLPAISTDRVTWLALFFLFFAEIGLKQRKFVAGNMRIELAMILLCVLGLFSMIQAGNFYKEGFQISLLLNSFVFPFSIFFLGKQIVDDEQKIKKVFVFFAIIGLYLGITGIFEYFKLDSLVFPSSIMNYSKGIHFGRARGPFLQASVNGMVIGTIIFITIYLLLQKNKKWVKRVLFISIIVMLIALLFTFTRAPWLAFILASLLIPVFFPQAKKIYLISFITLLIIIFIQFSVGQFKPRTYSLSKIRSAEETLTEKISGRAMSESPVYGRLNLYGVVWRMFLEKPFFGYGFNTFQEVSPKYFKRIKGIPYTSHQGGNIHDTWSGILVDLGLVGLGLNFFIIFYILRISLRLYRLLPSKGFLGRELVPTFWGTTVVFLVNIQFIEMRFFMFPNALFFLMAGIIVGMYQRSLLSNYKIGEKPSLS